MEEGERGAFLLLYFFSPFLSYFLGGEWGWGCGWGLGDEDSNKLDVSWSIYCIGAVVNPVHTQRVAAAGSHCHKNKTSGDL